MRGNVSASGETHAAVDAVQRPADAGCVANLTVVKVGGSLFDLPDLCARLRRWLTTAGPVVLIPGGGAAADAIRDFDCRFQLGEETSHWLALRAMTLNAHVLAVLLPAAVIIDRMDQVSRANQDHKIPILDCHAFCTADEGRPGCLPHSWSVTSDSVAARVAVVAGAQRLVLLKSLDIPPGTVWTEAARRGWVDPYFAEVIGRVEDLTVEAVNFRTLPIPLHLEAPSPSGPRLPHQ